MNSITVSEDSCWSEITQVKVPRVSLAAQEKEIRTLGYQIRLLEPKLSDPRATPELRKTASAAGLPTQEGDRRGPASLQVPGRRPSDHVGHRHRGPESDPGAHRRPQELRQAAPRLREARHSKTLNPAAVSHPGKIPVRFPGVVRSRGIQGRGSPRSSVLRQLRPGEASEERLIFRTGGPRLDDPVDAIIDRGRSSPARQSRISNHVQYRHSGFGHRRCL